MISVERVRQTAKFDEHMDKVFKTIRGQFQAEINTDLKETGDKILQALFDAVPYYSRSGMVKKKAEDLLTIHMSVYNHELLPIELHSAMYNDSMVILIKVEVADVGGLYEKD